MSYPLHFPYELTFPILLPIKTFKILLNHQQYQRRIFHHPQAAMAMSCPPRFRVPIPQLTVTAPRPVLNATRYRILPYILRFVLFHIVHAFMSNYSCLNNIYFGAELHAETIRWPVRVWWQAFMFFVSYDLFL